MKVRIGSSWEDVDRHREVVAFRVKRLDGSDSLVPTEDFFDPEWDDSHVVSVHPLSRKELEDELVRRTKCSKPGHRGMA